MMSEESTTLDLEAVCRAFAAASRGDVRDVSSGDTPEARAAAERLAQERG